jgi:hypothetical protein
MTSHVSASARQETSHVNRTTRTATIMNALTQRAQAALNDPSLDDQSRATLRYALEQNDPWLAELVRRADAREGIANTDHADSSRRKIEALADIICGVGGRSAAALFVLMGMVQNSSDPDQLMSSWLFLKLMIWVSTGRGCLRSGLSIADLAAYLRCKTKYIIDFL